MADPWDVVSQTPINPQPPAAAPPAADPWAVVSQTPSAPQTSAWDRFQQWAHSEGGDSTGSDVLDAIRDFGQGAGSSASEVPATLLGMADKLTSKAMGRNIEDPITAAFRRQVGLKPDTLSGKAGGLFENVAEWMVGEEALRGLAASERMTKLAPVVKMLERYPKIAEAAIAHPEIAKILPDAARQALIGGTQAGAHGASLEESLQTGAESGALGLALPMVVGGIKGEIGRLAETVQPTVRDLAGVEFRQLASEARGPNGELIAPKVAQKAAQYGSEPAIQTERQAAFKQLETNLAKRGIGNVVEDTNNAVSRSAAGGNILATAPGGDFRYIPPDGSASLTGPEARSVMDEMEQQWLAKDTTPEQDQAFQQAYDDIRNQLKRREAYTTNAYQTAAPYVLHDVEQIRGGVNSWRDAANQAEQLARDKMRRLGLSQQYQQLTDARDAAQSEFNKALNDSDLENHVQAQQNLRTTSQALENFVRDQGTQPNLPASVAQRAFTEQRVSNAFRELQNLMDTHMNLRPDTAAAIDRPRLVRRLGSLADNVESIKSEYGDVLTPVLGDQGLNHIIELGNLLDQPETGKAIKTFTEHFADVMRKHFAGGRSIITGGGPLYLGHLAGSFLGGAAGGLGVLGTEAYYRMMVNRMATDPAFAEKLITAAKEGMSPRKLAVALGGAEGLAGMQRADQQREEQTLQQMRKEAGLE